MSEIRSSQLPFLPPEPFLPANEAAIRGLFFDLAQDFPDRTITSERGTIATKQALQLSEEGELTDDARQWLQQHTIGSQHGYDRPKDRAQKLPIPMNDEKYLGHLSLINCGSYNFVTGGQPTVTVAGRNILVGGGFPHLNAGRLRAALQQDYNQLWDVNTVALLSGQRLRWNDNSNESTGATVLERTAMFTNFDLKRPADRKLIDSWQAKSPFARAEAIKPEGSEWDQIFATEAQMGRLAIELALLRMDDTAFDWDDYPVIEHESDDDQTGQTIDGHFVPGRTAASWEYLTKDGRSFYVINGAAVARPFSGQPRPTSASVMREAYSALAHPLAEKESVIAFGAPHIRGAYHTASELLDTATEQVKPLHISIDRWEFHEPPVTGIANIPGTDIVDRDLRSHIVSNS